MAETKDKTTKEATTAKAPAADPRFYTVKEDVTEKLPDGRIILVARKGTTMPVVQAVARGLIKTGKTGPTESKEGAPDETK